MLTASKRQRLDKLNVLRTAGVSDAALAKVLDKIKSEPGLLDDLNPTSRVLRDGTNFQLRSIELSIDLQLQSGGVFKWVVAPPLAMMNAFLKHVQHSGHCLNAFSCVVLAP